jgi:uncharacterized protein YprB with RNaseH-like and TPR domain
VPEGTVLPRNAPRPWTDLAVPTDPPAFQPVETPHGVVLVRRFGVEVPRALRVALARTEAAARLAGLPGCSLALDTEATGLGSTTLFLVGFAWFEGTAITIEQIFAKDHSREAALLSRVAGRWMHAGRLVTYNGRSYDLPLIRDRTIRHRLAPLSAVRDVDLLMYARRRWRSHLPDCRLTTVEACILGRGRRGDVAGAEIPEIYRRTVRADDFRLIAPVMHHNVLDLLTTLELLPRLDPGSH